MHKLNVIKLIAIHFICAVNSYSNFHRHAIIWQNILLAIIRSANLFYSIFPWLEFYIIFFSPVGVQSSFFCVCMCAFPERKKKYEKIRKRMSMIRWKCTSNLVTEGTPTSSKTAWIWREYVLSIVYDCVIYK